MMCKLLIFSCISAVMLVTAAYGATLSPEKVELLNSLIKDLELLGKSKHKIHLNLYTPKASLECSQQTLECYLAEISILRNEIAPEDAVTLQNIIKNLQRLKDLTPSGRGCETCEAHSQKTFPEFHQALLSFLRLMRK